MKECEYGCGQEAKYQFKNGKRCCSSNQMKCPIIIKKKEKTRFSFQHLPVEVRRKMTKGGTHLSKKEKRRIIQER